MKNNEDLKALAEELKIPPFRMKQIKDFVCKKFVFDYDLISVLPAGLRATLKNKLPLISLTPAGSSISKNGDTSKFLLKTESGELIETVLMHFEDGRNTVCVSTQSGCQMGCAFCATGKLGLKKNMTYEEIFDQVLYVCSVLDKQGQKLNNIVVMGMGEPFMNYDNTIKALKMVNSEEYLNIGARKITVSTSGVVPGILKFADEVEQFNLAISLHAPNQKLRESFMPIAKMYDINELINAVKLYIKKTNRRVSYEYILMDGINDSGECALELAFLLRGQLCHVNLIPFNAIDNSIFKPSSRKNVINFQKILHKKGINATIRVAMGDEIAAACGQLANKTLKNE